MRGRARGNKERIIILAHQTEAMARQKILRDAAYYIKKSEGRSNKSGAMGVLAMMQAFKARQDAAKKAD
ncbi:hypothetical protein [Sphingobium chungbukense]|uniref:Uncharacterized protein n=1 Tax=Sphingobium chungbukense TaxID=56193 RepID=A0A0M3AZ83_9SPHN|nr:hypothetical protein [Sphingobium chungbukense]KKW93869.1 hypothetical protein YP76_04220 [Sphingobium chungbukense]